jgi:hypothetical protein
MQMHLHFYDPTPPKLFWYSVYTSSEVVRNVTRHSFVNCVRVSGYVFAGRDSLDCDKKYKACNGFLSLWLT